jgi:cystathionine gamma-lyase
VKTGAKQPQHRPGTRTVPTGPFDLFLAMHGLQGRQRRIKAHCESALELAKWLEQLPAVERSGCPGLQGHPRHALAKPRMHGFGGIISVEIKGGLKKGLPHAGARRAVCAGRVARWHRKPDRTCRHHAAIMTHASVRAANRKRLDIIDGLVRLSAGGLSAGVEELTGLKGELAVASS